MSDPAWYIHAARAVHSVDAALHTICLWRSGELAAVAPLLYTGARGARYEIPGSRALYEPSEFVACDVDAATQLARAVAALERPVFLSRLPEDSLFLTAFGEVSRVAGITFHPRSSGAPYIELEAGWDAYYSALPSRIRNIVRRAERALAKIGVVEFEFRRPSVFEAAPLLQRVFEVEMRSWKARQRSAVLQREDLRSFFFGYGADAARDGTLAIAVLRFQGAIIAAHVASVDRGAYRQLKIGYDESHSKHLPGLQLLLQTIRWSFEQGLRSYEFMGTEERWIREWTTSARRCRSVLFYPFTRHGLSRFALDGLTRITQRLRQSAKTKTVNQCTLANAPSIGPHAGSECERNGRASQASSVSA